MFKPILVIRRIGADTAENGPSNIREACAYQPSPLPLLQSTTAMPHAASSKRAYMDIAVYTTCISLLDANYPRSQEVSQKEKEQKEVQRTRIADISIYGTIRLNCGDFSYVEGADYTLWKSKKAVCLSPRSPIRYQSHLRVSPVHRRSRSRRRRRGGSRRRRRSP